jgi:hypothetical protein
MKKQLLIVLLAFATLPTFATDKNQKRLILLEQLESMVIAGHNDLTYPTKKHNTLLLNIATDMYHNSNDPITTDMRNHSHRFAVRLFNALNTLEHNKTWLDAVKKHGIYNEETLTILVDLVAVEYGLTSQYYNDRVECERVEPFYPVYIAFYQAYIAFYKKHTGHSPNKNDFDRDYIALLKCFSVPGSRDILNQLLQKISLEIAMIKK